MKSCIQTGAVTALWTRAAVEEYHEDKRRVRISLRSDVAHGALGSAAARSGSAGLEMTEGGRQAHVNDATW